MEISQLANSEVLDFYRTLPFNIPGDEQHSIDAIRTRNLVNNYPCLPPLLAPGRSVHIR